MRTIRGSLSAVTVAGVLLLAGCGSGETDSAAAGEKKSGDYCATLTSARDDLNVFGGADYPDQQLVDRLLGEMDDLASQAPEEIAADWALVNSTVQGVFTALEEAGITLPDFMTAMMSSQIPEGMDPQTLQDLGEKLQKLAAPDLDTAAAAITEHADSACGVDLTGFNS